jgi:hypothetical protein
LAAVSFIIPYDRRRRFYGSKIVRSLAPFLAQSVQNRPKFGRKFVRFNVFKVEGHSNHRGLIKEVPVGYRRYLPTGLNGTLFLKVKLRHLQAVIDFMYRGQVQVCPQDLASFLDLAEELQVKGLTRRTSEQQPPNAATAKDELLQTPAKSSLHSVISKTDLEAKEGLLLASNNSGLVVKGVRSLNPEAFGSELEKEAARDSSAASLYDEAAPVRTSKDSRTADATKDSRSASRPPDKDEVKISMIVTHHSKRKTVPSSRRPTMTGNEGDSSSFSRKRSRQDSSAADNSSSSKSTSEPAASTSEPAASRQKSATQSRVLPVGSQGVGTETPNRHEN